MKYTLTSLIIIIFKLSFAQIHYLNFWSIANANLSQHRNYIINSTFTSRYNPNQKFHIAANLPIMIFSPNIQLKLNLYQHKPLSTQTTKFYSNFQFTATSAHTIFYPTHLFLIAKSFLKSDIIQNIPNAIFFVNEFFITFPIKQSACKHFTTYLTLKLGHITSYPTNYNFISTKSAYFNTIFYPKSKFTFGITLDKKIFNNLNLSQSFKLYLSKELKTIENLSLLYFDFGLRKKSQIAFGFLGAVSTYNSTYSLIPIFNFSHKFRKKSIKKQDINEYLQIY